MFFDAYINHTDAVISPRLLWEYDVTGFDYQEMRNVVVQRVVERGRPSDWYAALNLYGIDGMKEAIKALPYLNERDMNFVSVLFHISFNELRCYIQKQSHQAYWNS